MLYYEIDVRSRAVPCAITLISLDGNMPDTKVTHESLLATLKDAAEFGGTDGNGNKVGAVIATWNSANPKDAFWLTPDVKFKSESARQNLPIKVYQRIPFADVKPYLIRVKSYSDEILYKVAPLPEAPLTPEQLAARDEIASAFVAGMLTAVADGAQASEATPAAEATPAVDAIVEATNKKGKRS